MIMVYLFILGQNKQYRVKFNTIVIAGELCIFALEKHYFHIRGKFLLGKYSEHYEHEEHTRWFCC